MSTRRTVGALEKYLAIEGEPAAQGGQDDVVRKVLHLMGHVTVASRGCDEGFTGGSHGRQHRASTSAELLGETDEKSFGSPDVAEPIHVLILDHFADELCAAFAEPGERIVDVLDGEHDA